MADVTGKSPSLDQMVGGPTDSRLGGSMKPGGFQRPSGNMTPDNDTRVAPDNTPAGRG